MSSEILKNIIRKVDSLPTLPTTYARISELMRKPTTCALDIADVISRDQVLTARLLKLVNSAFYGFSGRITTVSSAVVVLGFRAIRSLVLSSSVMDLFKEKEANPFLDPVDFWKHSLAVAACSKLISKNIDYDDPEEFFVAGLLHDIGKLIQNQFLKASFLEALSHAEKSRMCLYDAELEKMGLAHSETGLMLCEKWKLPECIREAIFFHHTPQKSNRYPVFAAVVHVSNVIVKSLELGASGDSIVGPFYQEAWEILSFPQSQLEPLMHKLLIETEEIFQILKPARGLDE